MDYDPSEAALFRPESRPALPVDAGWSVDARCAELSRLAYVRAESEAGAEAALRTALAAAGYDEVRLFFVPRDSGRPRFGVYAIGVRDGEGRSFVAFRGTQADARGALIADARFLPPPIWFRHVAVMLYVDRLGTVHWPPPGLFRRMIDRLLGDLAYLRRYGLRRGHVWFRTCADHAPINYVAALLGRRVGP